MTTELDHFAFADEFLRRHDGEVQYDHENRNWWRFDGVSPSADDLYAFQPMMTVITDATARRPKAASRWRRANHIKDSLKVVAVKQHARMTPADRNMLARSGFSLMP